MVLLMMGLVAPTRDGIRSTNQILDDVLSDDSRLTQELS
jgi:hypothetical protein